ncbi:uncharacterized protein LOC143910216 isoform X2 [Arctopsyche grandis]|uniref:uncharacterized protein LOC143910216 isoform X2 n=1 Tax=Arctopsyche grandis TaxID=121162 RepID=UPI00406D6E06
MKAKISDTKYQEWLVEQEQLESFKIAEAERIHEEDNEKWLRSELIAQQQWRQLQAKIAKARFERAQQDLLIKKEWEEQQNKLKQAEKARKDLEEEQLRCHQELMERIEQFASGHGELPTELLTIKETNADKEICPFYSKIGICRFGDCCSRNHRKPSVSKVLLARNFYSHFGIEQSASNEYDTDILLEYDEKETYKHFKDFFDDVLPEFQQFGNIIQFKVCCNFERHLRGNTYIEYSSLRDAVKAYKVFHGRWYGGKQVSLQFCDVPSWKQAICGLFASNRCPKGRACNFLHVFHNPNDMFGDSMRRNGSHNYKENRHSVKSRSRDCDSGRNWRWSESPEPHQNHGKLKKPSKSDQSPKDTERKSKHRKKRRSRSRSRSRSERHSKRQKSSRSSKEK